MSKKTGNYLITPVYYEWKQKEHPLVSSQRDRELKQAFMVGAWAAMGIASRISKLDRFEQRQGLYESLRQEIADNLGITLQKAGPKVRAYIDGQPID